MVKKIMMLIFAIIFFTEGVKAQCKFSVTKDMEEKAPMIISVMDGRTILVPNRYGQIKMNIGDKVYLACPGTTNSVVNYGSKIVTATCRYGKAFKIDKRLESITDIECRQYPRSYAVNTGGCAGNRGQLVEIGFQFNKMNNTQITLCFDPKELKTFWTKTIVISGQFTVPVNSLPFDKSYFGNVNPDDRYKQQHHRLPHDYVSNNRLQRGHLVARYDFLDAASKRMTYYYINTAPQWRSFNTGNWKNLEIAIRKKVSQRNPGLYVYTGTHGILKLDNEKITLDSSGKMPVPLYFWKVVIDKRTGRGVAFVGVNDPFHEYRPICADVCDEISWLGNLAKLRKRRKYGVVYCCTVNKLRAVPNIVLPKYPEFNSGLLD